MKAIGIIPARMSASRFYGKPLHPILGIPMLEHVFIRAKMYKKWRDLVVATCDKEIKSFCERKGFPVVMTSSSHRRALDRVAEASNKLSSQISINNLVVCVQGDEPMLEPGMISKLIVPFKKNKSIASTVLAMHITEESIWRNPDTVKLSMITIIKYYIHPDLQFLIVKKNFQKIVCKKNIWDLRIQKNI